MKSIEGTLSATGLRVALVAARFNYFIVEKLLAGAVDTLVRHGAEREALTVLHVPGSFELPLACKELCSSRRFDAVIALGCIIRGSTSHYDLVCAEAAKGISSASLQSGVPVGFGVITTENIEQAIERAGTKAGNKGIDAALAAIEMAQLLRELRRSAE